MAREPLDLRCVEELCNSISEPIQKCENISHFYSKKPASELQHWMNCEDGNMWMPSHVEHAEGEREREHLFSIIEWSCDLDFSDANANKLD